MVSICHLTMLHVSNRGIVEKLRRNQNIAREYYMATLNSNRSPFYTKVNRLNSKRARSAAECDHVGMAMLNVREEFIATIKPNEDTKEISFLEGNIDITIK